MAASAAAALASSARAWGRSLIGTKRFGDARAPLERALALLDKRAAAAPDGAAAAPDGAAAALAAFTGRRRLGFSRRLRSPCLCLCSGLQAFTQHLMTCHDI